MTWTVPRLWHDETVFVLAGGPSLRGFDRARLRGRRVLVVNYAALYPEADAMYAADYRSGWRWLAGAHQMNVTTARGYGEHVHRLLHTGADGLDTSGRGLRMGGTSLHGAINLAAVLGAGRIVLLGADMRVADDGATHWDGRRNHRYQRDPGMFTRVYQRCLCTTVNPLRALGIECVNATPGSALTCFPMVGLDDELHRMEAAA